MRIFLACLFLACLTMPTAVPTPALAMPSGMTDACKRLYREYQSLGSPKAFATGKPNACGAKGPGGGISLSTAKRQAIASCRAYGGQNCKVVESRP